MAMTSTAQISREDRHVAFTQVLLEIAAMFSSPIDQTVTIVAGPNRMSIEGDDPDQAISVVANALAALMARDQQMTTEVDAKTPAWWRELLNRGTE